LRLGKKWVRRGARGARGVERRVAQAEPIMVRKVRRNVAKRGRRQGHSGGSIKQGKFGGEDMKRRTHPDDTALL
jgi:hypothetical protein